MKLERLKEKKRRRRHAAGLRMRHVAPYRRVFDVIDHGSNCPCGGPGPHYAIITSITPSGYSTRTAGVVSLCKAFTTCVGLAFVRTVDPVTPEMELAVKRQRKWMKRIFGKKRMREMVRESNSCR